MKVPAAAQQAIDIHRETEQTKLDIATAVASKQLDSAKQQGEAVVQLVEQAAAPKRGIDVKA
jgi:hypothetical protein